MRAVLAAAVLAAFSAAQAQDKPAAAPPPSWQQGKPPAMSESTLHPFAIEMTGKPSKDLPVNKLKVPSGFKVEVWAEGMPGARSMALGDKGTVFVGTRQLKEMYAVVDRGGKREAKVLLKDLDAPNGVVFNKGTLYVAERHRITRYDGIESQLDNPPQGTVVVDNRDSRKGMHFGYPFCHQGDTPDPQFGKNRSCKEFDPPALKLGAHIAPIGMRFYSGKMFPAEYQNNIFIAMRGSWNRTIKQGYNVMRVVLDDAGKVAKYEPFLTGFLVDEKADPPMWGRPNDVMVMRDGSLLVSDDQNGVIYRVSYAGK